MKKSNGNAAKIIIGVVCVLLVLAVGMTVGTLLGEKKQITTETKENQADTKKEPISETAEKETAQKGTAEKGTAEKETAGTKANGQTEKESDKVSENVATVGGTAVYDASLPDDSPAIHRYEFILSDCTWMTAFQDCLDRGGYLVRINSETEYEHIRKEIVNQGMTNIFFRIGGKRDRSNQDYHWSNQDSVLFGETLNSEYSWCSDEWGQGQPSYQDGNLEETYMDLFFSDSEKRFVWNDVPNDMLEAEPAYAGALGYICEYE